MRARAAAVAGVAANRDHERVMDSPTLAWWSFLCAVSALNVLAWIAATASLRRRYARAQPATWAAMRLQVLLSAGYVLGCAYRCAFPVFDVRRLCLVDSWLSSVIVGRSVATTAELCFAAQWALLLRAVATSTGSATGARAAQLVVPMIATAQLCCWYAVLTTSNLGHVFEESIWATCAAMLVASLLPIWPRCPREVRPILAATCVAGLGYVVYMAGVDVPMYWARWIADTDHGRQYLSLAQGLADMSGRWIVSHRWADWKSEVVWMSLYFSVAVWLSIGLAHVPAYFGTTSSPPAGASGTRRAARRASLHRDALGS